MTRIAKTDQRRIKDFKEYVNLLRDSIARVKRGDMAYQKTSLSVLRTLICRRKGNDLLREISLITSLPIELRVCYLDNCEQQTLDQYIDGEGPFIHGRQYSREEYIYELSSQDGSHSDKDMDKELVLGENLFLGGMPANARQIFAYAQTVLIACEQQINHLKK